MLRSDRTIACWGQSQWDWGATRPPVGTFRTVHTVENFACGITTEGAIKCWGNNPDGLMEAAPDRPFVSIAGACGVTDRAAFTCWGPWVRSFQD